jgi:hypothetical protein
MRVGSALIRANLLGFDDEGKTLSRTRARACTHANRTTYLLGIEDEEQGKRRDQEPIERKHLRTRTHAPARAYMYVLYCYVPPRGAR